MTRLSGFIFVLFLYAIFALEVKSIEGPVSVSQSAPKYVGSGEQFIIKLTITKEGTESFAKIQQPLPKGFSAVAVLSAGAQFSFEEQTVKFIWDKLPEANEFSVSYKVTVDPMMVGLMRIGGVFAFVKNQDRVLVEIGAIEINVKPAESVAEEIIEEAPTGIVEEKIESNEEVPEVVAVFVDKEVVLESTKEEQKPAPTPIKKQRKSFIFKIQIAAAYRKIDVSFLAKKYNISNKISEEIHNKMYKYTVGSFDTYSEAKLYLNKVLNTFAVKGAFITAYQGKLRIPVNQTFK